MFKIQWVKLSLKSLFKFIFMMFIVEGDENADPIMKILFNEFQNKTSFLKLILRKHSINQEVIEKHSLKS